MRTQEDIIKDYDKACEDDEMAVVPGYERVYGYKNQPLRDKLREEYIGTLPMDKKLAIYLHNKLCRSNHTDGCSFHYEVRGIVDEWDRYAHKEYLEKAHKALDAVKSVNSNISDEDAMQIVKAVTNAVR